MKHSILTIILLNVFITLNAQTEFKTKISKDAVMIGEPFRVEYTINRNFDNFNLTDTETFEVVSGPSTSFQQNMNISNGVIEKKVTVNYTYILKAKIPGKQTIPAAEVNIGEEYFYSEPIEVIVINAQYTDPKKNEMKNIEGTSKL